MNRTRRVLPILAAILAAGMGGYWLGHNGIGTSELMTTTGAAQTNAPAPSGLVIRSSQQRAGATAKALGLTIPDKLLALADEVIE